MKRFGGIISNCKKEVLTHTSGSTTIESKRNLILFWDMRVEGGGKVETTHEHYTDFEIDDKVFRCYGDFMFKDGDKVSLYATESSKGYYRVEWIKNFTRDFSVGKKPANPNKSLYYKQKSNKMSLWEDIIVGAVVGGIMIGPIIGIPIAVIAWGFYDAQFWKSFKITWLITAIVSIVCFILPHIITKANQQNNDKNKDIVNDDKNGE